MTWLRILFVVLAWSVAADAGTASAAAPSQQAPATPVFIEAETFIPSSAGWVVSDGPDARQASNLHALSGAAGPGDATASGIVRLPSAGRYRVWVRFRAHPTERGPFTVTLLADGRERSKAVFDLEAPAGITPRSFRGTEYVWRSLDADLPAGDVTLRLAKHETKASGAAARHVDCFLLTTDTSLVPDHNVYRPRTYLRVTFGDGYDDRPVYLHVFADHYRAPWYAHYSVSGGATSEAGVHPRKGSLLKSGGSTGWCDITPMLYEDSGALLNLSARYSFAESASRLRATLEFATAPDDRSVVRTIRADCQPNGLVVVMPPDLLTPQHLAQLKTADEIADQTGKVADAFDWPTFGKLPTRFPFFVQEKAAGASVPVDAAVVARERKTLGYMGFTPDPRQPISGGIWLTRGGSFSAPDLDAMKTRAAENAAKFKQAGHSLADIYHCQLTDEPTGQKTPVIAADPASVAPFRAWLKAMGKTPRRPARAGLGCGAPDRRVRR